MPTTTVPISLLQQTITEFGVLAVGVTLVTSGALLYFRRVRMERPPIGTFNGRDIVILLVFISVLPFLYGYLPYWLITCILILTFSSALYIGYNAILGKARTWLGIGLLIGLNYWTSHHLMGSTAGWQLWWTELTILVGLGAIAVSNLYVQGGMKLKYVAWLALGLAVYDIIFATVLPLTDQLVAGYLSHPLDPLLGMRFGIDNYGVGLGDLLVYSLFLVAAYKAYGAKAARIAFGLILVMGAFVTAFIPFLFNFLDTELDLLVPSQALFGPAAFLCYLWMKRRYGPGADDGGVPGQRRRRARRPPPARRAPRARTRIRTCVRLNRRLKRPSGCHHATGCHARDELRVGSPGSSTGRGVQERAAAPGAGRAADRGPARRRLGLPAGLAAGVSAAGRPAGGAWPRGWRPGRARRAAAAADRIRPPVAVRRDPAGSAEHADRAAVAGDRADRRGLVVVGAARGALGPGRLDQSPGPRPGPRRCGSRSGSAPGCWPRRAAPCPGSPGWSAWAGAWSCGCSGNRSAGSSRPA